MRNGGLIDNPNFANVSHCYYNMTIDKVFYPAEPYKPLTSEEGVNGSFVVKPTDVVWIRMKEILNLGNDICAFLHQTNEFSRKGLSIQNLTSVSPGYVGPITFIAANLSGRPIEISWGDCVARVFFSQLGQPTSRPRQRATDDELHSYDRAISQELYHRENSFLDIEALREKLSNSMLEEAERVTRRATRSALIFGAIIVFGVTVIPPLSSYVHAIVNDSGYYVLNRSRLADIMVEMEMADEGSSLAKRIEAIERQLADTVGNRD
jgi:deoxycytidine triphosphate deaminase